MYELHGIILAYEMRIVKENPSKKEATFKASKETKNKEKDSIDIYDKESYVKEA